MANATFGSRFFFDDLPEDFVVQGQVRVHFLEFGVLFLEFLKPRYIEAPADFIGRYSGLKFVNAFNDFRFGMSLFSLGCSFATKGSILTQAESPFV